MRKRTTFTIGMAMAVVGGLHLLSAVGCSKRPTLPPTYPVQGKVVFQNGQAVSSGDVWFQPSEDSRVTTSGKIQSDGTFTLQSSMAGSHSSGAIAGPHRVVVVTVLKDRPARVVAAPHSPPPKNGAPAATVTVPNTHTVTLPETYTVKPGDNQFTLTIPKPSP